MEYKTQAKDAGKYKARSYMSPRRWSSYAIQVRETMLTKAERVLEIGPGNNIVTGILKNMGFQVETLDLDDRLGADHVGSITDAKVAERLAGKFDLMLACQIFEHVRYEDFLKALASMRDIAPKAILSLPHTESHSRFFHLAFKLPLLGSLSFSRKLIYKTFKYEFNGEHYWEIGTKGYPLQKVISDIKGAGWKVEKDFFNPENPYHYFFVLNRK